MSEQFHKRARWVPVGLEMVDRLLCAAAGSFAADDKLTPASWWLPEAGRSLARHKGLQAHCCYRN